MRDAHGIIFSYQVGAKLKELTEHRTVSSLPFGGRYRTIDFMLSNMINAGITNVGVIMQEHYQSLLDHLGSGKDWDLSRKHGGLRLLPPFGFANSTGSAVYRGKMEALHCVRTYIQRVPAEYIVLATGELVSTLPLEEMIEMHAESGADITAVCTSNQVGETIDTVHMILDANSIVRDISAGYKMPQSYEALDVYIIEKKLLLGLIEHCASHNFYDFERDVLQNMLGSLTIRGHLFNGYTARPQSVISYFNQSMDLLKKSVRNELFPRERPVYTKIRDDASTYYSPTSVVKNCIVADGCYFEGTVENSIIFKGVRIGKGAKVKNSILMQDVWVHDDAVLNFAIADKDVVINEGRMLVGYDTYPISISKGSVV